MVSLGLILLPFYRPLFLSLYGYFSTSVASVAMNAIKDSQLILKNIFQYK